MFTLPQVNIGLNLGIIYVLLGAAYLILMVFFLVQRATRLTNWALSLYIIQAIFIPVLMLLCGLILIFQGWRLDPVLQFGQFLSFLIIIYFSIKDIVINAVYRNR
ncbi:MAG: Ycf66 family protein [Tolypothrix carrinoi HA7290-LM1]|jgi:small-conductance mechanosensitive channel|nr:Ycf66 family protein [Tolypothrix carrinoi HA7290-LM1]